MHIFEFPVAVFTSPIASGLSQSFMILVASDELGSVAVTSISKVVTMPDDHPCTMHTDFGFLVLGSDYYHQYHFLVCFLNLKFTIFII